MALKAAQCPNCGGELQLPEDKNKVTCMYCDTSIVVSEAIEQKKNNISEDADKLLNLITSSIETGDLEQASKNINQLLELNTEDFNAWTLKGKVAYLKIAKEMKIPPMDPRGLDDSVLSVNLVNTFNEGFNKSIMLADDDKEKQEIVGKYLHEAIKEVSNAIVDAYKVKFFYGIKMYDSSIHNRQSHWGELIKQSIELEHRAYKLNPSFDCAYNAISIWADANATFMMDLKSFKIPKNLSDWFDEARAKYPEQFKEKEEKEKTENPSGCFIATATTGNNNHPVVMDLRFFRDQWLLNKIWGRKFVELYYKHGPYPARLIQDSRILKSVSYWMIVKPLHLVSSLLISKTK